MLESWGLQGLHRHLQLVQAEYHRRRALSPAAMEQHLAGLITWIVPDAGMFYWLNILDEHDTTELVADLMDHKRCVLIPPSGLKPARLNPGLAWGFARTGDGRVMMMPGAVFSVTNSPSSFIRTSFAYATDDEIVEGFRYEKL